MSQIAFSSFIVTIFTVLGLGLSFLSSVVIAAKFGAGKEMDMYLAATTVPLFIVSILSSALNFTFIPLFAEYRSKSTKERWKVVSSFINLNIAVTVTLCIFGIIFAYPIMKMVTPGFSGEKLARAAELLQWLLPIIIFVAINELLASVYYSNQRFVIPSLSKIISPLFVMALVLLFHDFLSTKSIVFALLAASCIQTVLLAIGFYGTRDFNYFFILDYKHPGVIKILKLMTPLILGMVVYRAVPIVDRFFLSKLPEGSISHNGYAMQMMSVIPSIIASGISVAIFPVISKYAAESNWAAFKEIISQGIKMVFFLSIPVVVLLGLYGKPVIQMLLERETFTAADTTAVYYAFAIYLLALPASTIGSIVSQGFYALQQNQVIAIIGVIMMGLYVVLCLLFLNYFSYLAIPAAFAIYHNCAIVTTMNVLRRKIGENKQPTIVNFFIKCTISALISAALIYPGIRFDGEKVFAANALCAAGFFIYVLISKYALHLKEPDLIFQTVLLSLKRKAI